MDKAVSNAAEAFHDWAEMPPARRVQVLYRYRELLIQNIDEMARLLSSEHGKTVDDVRAERMQGEGIRRLGQPDDVASLVHYLCQDEARHIQGTGISVDGGATKGYF